MSKPVFLVTGASGFVGSALVRSISQRYQVFGVTRRCFPSAIDCITYEELWALDKCDVCHSLAPTCLIHCAALAHRSPPRTQEQFQALSSVNIELSVRLAELAKRLGIQRFIFLSSIGVHGSSTPSGLSISEVSSLLPSNPYSASKCEAEARLHKCLDGSSCGLTIVRPALVYGQGMPGNLRKLVRAIDAGIPLPFDCIRNRRSFISLANLVSAIQHVALHHRAAREAYVVADAETISIADFIRAISRIRGKPCRLFPVPVDFVMAARHVPLVGGVVRQLVDDLVVDSSKICKQLDWRHPFSQAEGLEHSFAPES